MARLIRTEKEVEGRYTEQWIVVEEDALDQWPEGPLTHVGRGVPHLSCITLVHAVEHDVTTIEGLRDHPLVDAFVAADALQCGFCTPGQIVSASALVDANPHPTREQIRHHMAGNICRCGAYPNIEEAILAWQG